ncbi:hypothetical protein BDP27DRAFT_1406090 [Rhodocollybia butyracea]|uniref:DUF4246 domain-containing protein n=1 Tax=Rhodocollybia butyracea TaxID=206335 RepID=A0A9P5PG67_9AGAR|nr:hypothetical protein BDP27DRAFT_1406090 [Rhodocollybia butyracea]
MSLALYGIQGHVPQLKSSDIAMTDRCLTRFCIAVRQKKDWKSKIFDEKIALQWVNKAGHAFSNARVLASPLRDAVSDLWCSALALTTLESEISLDASDSSLEPFDMNMIETNEKNSLKYARGSKYALREPELKESGLGIFISDDLVPPALHQELMRQLDTLAAKEPQDFHPGSSGKVQDLIDPSLYPYIAGTTPVLSSDVKLPPFGKDNMFHTKLIDMVSARDTISSYASIPSVFQISPDGTDAHINSYINGLGTREQYPGLFRVIEKMFLLALSHFEKTLKQSAEYATKYSTSVERWTERRDFAIENGYELTREMWTEFLNEQSSEWDARRRDEKQAKEELQRDIRQEECVKTTFYDLGNEFAASQQYKGKEMKVIVKAVNYMLIPGQEYKGLWHMEGMPHEQIVASVFYYYDSNGQVIQDEGLDFRKFRDSIEDFPHLENSDDTYEADYTHEIYTHEDFALEFTTPDGDNDGCDDHYPSDWETDSCNEGPTLISSGNLSRFVELGRVSTTNICPGSNGTGRMISFPNWIHHKVAQIKNGSVSGDRVASRKILCFFLVDDTSHEEEIHHHGFSLKGLGSMNVLTTSEVPMQMRKCNKPTMFTLISKISTRLTGGTALPPELLDIIWRYISEGTLTREEAEMHRLMLMQCTDSVMHCTMGY